jgi:response regulator of citrate/malate metabolism
MNLFTQPPDNGTTTSKAAAKSVDAATLRACVLETIEAAAAGLTREEIEAATGLSGNTVRPRVWELVHAGLVAECGTRRTASGRAAAVMVRVKGAKE